MGAPIRYAEGVSGEEIRVAETPKSEPACHQVLVVDDHDDTRDVFTAMLEAQGFDVTPTWNAYAAYQELRRG
jgi:hypothetical protein